MGIFGNSPNVFDPQLDKATDECNTQEDWGLIMAICDKVKTTNDGSKEFCKAVLKKINHRVPHVSLQALVVLDSCVYNCGIDFKKEVASQDFLNNMRHIILNSHPKVASYMKMLIRKWSDEFKDEAQLSRLASFYHFMRSEGIEFPTEEELKPQKKSAPVSKDPNVVSSQQEADDIAKAIEMSLKEEQGKKSLSGNLATSSSNSSSSGGSLYPSMLGGSASTSTNSSASYSLSSDSRSKKTTVKAIYDFEAAEDNELTFKAGDLITILDDSDANWWKGEGSHGVGLFPANFVTTDLTVEPEPEFGVGKKDDEDETDGNSRSVSFNEEVEVKEVDLNDPVLEIDEELMEKTLLTLQNTDPETQEHDSTELLKDEESCTQMGPLIDAKLEDIDRKHLEYSQLNEKILEALNMYDKLMNEMPIYNPALPNPYMKNQAAPGMNPYVSSHMMTGPHPGFSPSGASNIYTAPQVAHLQQVNIAGASAAGIPNTSSPYNMYHQAGPVPANNTYAMQNGVHQPQGMPPTVHQSTSQTMTQSNFPQQQQQQQPHTLYSDPSSTVVHSNPITYANQNTLPYQQFSANTYSPGGHPSPSGQAYNPAVPTMQSLM